MLPRKATGDAALINIATHVALLRHGTTTVMTMRNSYAGPLEDFVMVVPVPVVLGKDAVKVVHDGVFERLERTSAPRLVTFTERDHCEGDPTRTPRASPRRPTSAKTQESRPIVSFERAGSSIVRSR